MRVAVQAAEVRLYRFAEHLSRTRPATAWCPARPPDLARVSPRSLLAFASATPPTGHSAAGNHPPYHSARPAAASPMTDHHLVAVLLPHVLVDLPFPARHADLRAVQADRSYRLDLLTDRFWYPVPCALSQPPVVRAAHLSPSPSAAQRSSVRKLTLPSPSIRACSGSRSRSTASSASFALRRRHQRDERRVVVRSGSPVPSRNGSPLRARLGLQQMRQPQFQQLPLLLSQVFPRSAAAPACGWNSVHRPARHCSPGGASARRSWSAALARLGPGWRSTTFPQ